MTYPTDDAGNPRVDFVFGNVPLQPNDQRQYSGNQLGILDSHDIAATEWNSYPFLGDRKPGSANYSITSFEFLGDVVYECTSQNNLKAGDTIVITGVPYLAQNWERYTTTVSYADANRFQFLAEIGYPSKETGLTGRVDVITSNYDGNTLEGGSAFYWPAIGFCNTNGGAQGDIHNAIEYFVSVGVPRAYFKDFTFSGGDNEWDANNGEPNWDGAIWYIYVPADYRWGTNGSGAPTYGSDLEGQIAWGNWNSNQEVSIDTEYPEDYSLVVISNDPRKDNAWWWWN